MRLFAHELRGQLLLYLRSKELAFFTFMLPLILFVLLGSVYGHDRIEGFKGSHFLEAGMLGYGVVSTAFAGLAIFMVIRRESGILNRVRAQLGGDDRPGTGAVQGSDPDPPALARARFAVRRDRFRGDGARTDRGDPLGRRLFGARERDLPADVVHLRLVLLTAFVPPV